MRGAVQQCTVWKSADKRAKTTFRTTLHFHVWVRDREACAWTLAQDEHPQNHGGVGLGKLAAQVQWRLVIFVLLGEQSLKLLGRNFAMPATSAVMVKDLLRVREVLLPLLPGS